MRKPLHQEVKIRIAVDKAIASALRPSFIPPPYLASSLYLEGVEVTRQLVTRRMNELGIFWDETTGLWLKKEK